MNPSIVLLTTNSRKAFGDEAKEVIVGVYLVKDLQRFNRAVDTVMKAFQEKSRNPHNRVWLIKSLMADRGFVPERTEEIFMAIS